MADWDWAVEDRDKEIARLRAELDNALRVLTDVTGLATEREATIERVRAVLDETDPENPDDLYENLRTALEGGDSNA